ncbi:hypothetical protein [Agromyces subbeticus]|uniref:hypothetical protein n=1 Tax=Agromyces subbeticus TaxID=293890 RepID=UPI0003B65AE6|nr:hypothetical protein [Agromyces subbeticus]
MSKQPTEEDTTGHVVHLLDRLDGAAAAPESLLLPKRMRAPGRVVFALVSLVASVGAVFAITMLWIEETPGWWFSLIFTVMIGGIPVALWAILIGSIEEARVERAMQLAWRDGRHRARAAAGTVAERRTGLSDDGSVSSFDLVVTLGDGQTIAGSWRPPTASGRRLLQTQVPGVGTLVRVWNLADAGAGSSASPVVIEVADPTVVVQP